MAPGDGVGRRKKSPGRRAAWGRKSNRRRWQRAASEVELRACVWGTVTSTPKRCSAVQPPPKPSNVDTRQQERRQYQAGSQRDEPLGAGAVESTCHQLQRRMEREIQLWSRGGTRPSRASMSSGAPTSGNTVSRTLPLAPPPVPRPPRTAAHHPQPAIPDLRPLSAPRRCRPRSPSPLQGQDASNP